MVMAYASMKNLYGEN
uniref:Uncharacterized protein n=1 Tax=Oryza meridionalis TaxID=40149 RepID=A0A0E0CUU9_9ORYZ